MMLLGLILQAQLVVVFFRGEKKIRLRLFLYRRLLPVFVGHQELCLQLLFCLTLLLRLELCDGRTCL